MDVARIAIEWGKIILSWPVITLTLGIIFIWNFGTEIKTLIRSIKTIKWRDAEVSNLGEQATESGEPKKYSPEEVEALNNEHRAEIDELKKKYDKEQEALITVLLERSEQNEFKYLNQFFAQNTKIALRELEKKSETSSNLKLRLKKFLNKIDTENRITDKDEEVEAIMNALIANECVTDKNGLLSITPKGTRFLRFITTEPK